MPISYKAYKLYNLDSKQIIISRYVIFYEYVLPFKITGLEHSGHTAD